MSKRTLILMMVLVLAIAAALAWYFLLGTNTSPLAEEGNVQSDNNLFPFGSGSSNNGTNSGVNSGSTSTVEIGGINEVTGLPRMRQISTTPAAGIVAFDKASTTMIRYIERATGHIYETDSSKAQINKVSNVTVPKIYEALWASDGSQVVVRYLNSSDTIKTFNIEIIPLRSPEDAIEGTLLPDNITNISSFGTKIFYITKNSGGSNGITSNFNGTGKASVWSSSFGDWMPRWTSSSAITLYSKPSYAAMGAGYVLNPTNGSYTKVASDMRGLTALANNDASLVFLSSRETNSIKSFVFDVKSGTTEPLGVSTLADKCVWSAKEKSVIYCAVPVLPSLANYPDDWYKGKVSFSDSLWRINASSGETKEILNPLFESNVSMDILDLSLNQSETVLVFKNKKDQTVWRYELTE